MSGTGDNRRSGKDTPIPDANQDFPGAHLRKLHVPGSSLPPMAADKLQARIAERASVPSAPDAVRTRTSYGPSSYSTTEIEREISRWSWAAFLWGGFWAIGHRVWIGLLAFVPVLGLLMLGFLGARGRALAWRSREWRNLDHFVRTQRLWVKWWFILAAVLLVLGAGVALAVPAYRTYRVAAKRAEAQKVLTAMAQGLMACVRETRVLPESTAWIPATLELVRHTEYRSSPAEWRNQPAFDCAAFSLGQPQSFRYRWFKVDGASGTLQAEADLNGDGAVDESVGMTVTCSPRGECAFGEIR